MGVHDPEGEHKCFYSNVSMLNAGSGRRAPICEADFHRPDQLASHLRSHHSEDIKYCLMYTHEIHNRPVLAQGQIHDQQHLLASESQACEDYLAYLRYRPFLDAELEELGQYRQLFGSLAQWQQSGDQQQPGEPGNRQQV